MLTITARSKKMIDFGKIIKAENYSDAGIKVEWSINGKIIIVNVSNKGIAENQLDAAYRRSVEFTEESKELVKKHSCKSVLMYLVDTITDLGMEIKQHGKGSELMSANSNIEVAMVVKRAKQAFVGKAVVKDRQNVFYSTDIDKINKWIQEHK
jgi:hypothetical protein